MGEVQKASYIKRIRRVTEFLVTCDGHGLKDGVVVTQHETKFHKFGPDREEVIEDWREVTAFEKTLLDSLKPAARGIR